jgi:hypothetical protein
MWGFEHGSCQEAVGFPGPRCGECVDCAREDEERRQAALRSVPTPPVVLDLEKDPAPPRGPTVLVVDTSDQIREGMRARGMREGDDFTIVGGRVVWSAEHLRRRGWCCNHGCRNCPWR